MFMSVYIYVVAWNPRGDKERNNRKLNRLILQQSLLEKDSSVNESANKKKCFCI